MTDHGSTLARTSWARRVGAVAGVGLAAAGPGPGAGGTGTGTGLATGAVGRSAGGAVTVGLNLDDLAGRLAFLDLLLVRAANGAVTLAAMPAMLGMPAAGAPGAIRSWAGGGATWWAGSGGTWGWYGGILGPSPLAGASWPAGVYGMSCPAEYCPVYGISLPGAL
jgi:hypothetical protein